MKLEPWKEAPWKKDSFIIPLKDLALLSFLGSALIAKVEALYASAATCENNICAIALKTPLQLSYLYKEKFSKKIAFFVQYKLTNLNTKICWLVITGVPKSVKTNVRCFLYL